MAGSQDVIGTYRRKLGDADKTSTVDPKYPIIFSISSSVSCYTILLLTHT